MFDELELFSSRGRRRANRSLRANVKPSPKASQFRIAVAVFVLCVLAGLVALLIYGISYAGKRLFAANPMYAIRTLDIPGDGDIVSYFIREKKGIREGTNLFAFDIERLREEFLQQRFAAKYSTMEVTRHLPDTLRIVVTERVPIARFTGAGGLVADDDGYVFGLASGRQALPIVVGCNTPPLPGERVEGNARAATAMLGLMERTGLSRELDVASIDVGGGFRGRADDLRIRLSDETIVDLWWAHGDEPADTPGDLQGRLEFLAKVLSWGREHGRRFETVNLTLENYTNNCPATVRN